MRTWVTTHLASEAEQQGHRAVVRVRARPDVVVLRVWRRARRRVVQESEDGARGLLRGGGVRLGEEIGRTDLLGR